jgi:hypothetical protein
MLKKLTVSPDLNHMKAIWMDQTFYFDLDLVCGIAK